MISELDAKPHVARLSGLPFAPTTKDGVRELQAALMCATDVRQAKAVIDDILGEFTECPAPADIRRMIFARQESAKEGGWQPSESTCKCGGTGWVHSDRVINGAVYPFSAPCKCRLPIPQEAE